MEMLQESSLRFVLALAVVLGLIALTAWLARRFRFAGIPGLPAGSARLEMIDSLTIDARKRLVIIRCDDQEHLLLIGPETGQVIEAGIAGAARDAASPGERKEEAA